VLTAAKAKAPFSSIKRKAAPLLQKQHSILFSTIPSRDQDSGKKVVTANDADDDAEEELKKGLLLTKGNAAPSAAAAAGGSVAGKKRGAGAAAAASKPMCKFHPKCFRKNKEHLEMYDHPPPEEGGDADEDDELDGPEPRNGDMPDDPEDPDYVDGPGGKKKKLARTEKVTAPGAAAAASPTASPSKAPASPSKPAAQKACYYGSACYNKDPDHVRRFSHPPPPPPPRTKEEFIETTNQSQHDLRSVPPNRVGQCCCCGRPAAKRNDAVLTFVLLALCLSAYLLLFLSAGSTSTFTFGGISNECMHLIRSRIGQ